jgi:hypothetical protein
MITPAAKTRVAINARESPTRSRAEEALTSFTFLLAALDRCQPDTKKAAVNTAIEAKTTSKEAWDRLSFRTTAFIYFLFLSLQLIL